MYGFFFKKGVYNSDPINDFIQDWFEERPLLEHLSIGATNFLSGKFSRLVNEYI
jgi:hypothetical protein